MPRQRSHAKKPEKRPLGSERAQLGARRLVTADAESAGRAILETLGLLSVEHRSDVSGDEGASRIANCAVGAEGHRRFRDRRTIASAQTLGCVFTAASLPRPRHRVCRMADRAHVARDSVPSRRPAERRRLDRLAVVEAHAGRRSFGNTNVQPLNVMPRACIRSKAYCRARRSVRAKPALPNEQSTGISSLLKRG